MTKGRRRKPLAPHTVLIDASSPEVVAALDQLTAEELEQLEQTLQQLAGMTWDQVIRSKGIHWEKIPVPNPRGGTSYSMRITRKMRAIAYRDGDFLRIVSLHPDHDSAYER